jgi:hypothetical protein
MFLQSDVILKLYEIHALPWTQRLKVDHISCTATYREHQEASFLVIQQRVVPDSNEKTLTVLPHCRRNFEGSIVVAQIYGEYTVLPLFVLKWCIWDQS